MSFFNRNVEIIFIILLYTPSLANESSSQQAAAPGYVGYVTLRQVTLGKKNAKSGQVRLGYVRLGKMNALRQRLAHIIVSSILQVKQKDESLGCRVLEPSYAIKRSNDLTSAYDDLMTAYEMARSIPLTPIQPTINTIRYQQHKVSHATYTNSYRFGKYIKSACNLSSFYVQFLYISLYIYILKLYHIFLDFQNENPQTYLIVFNQRFLV